MPNEKHVVNSRAKVQARIRVMVIILLGMMMVVVLRYGYLQLVMGEELSERMRYQVGQEYSIQSPRGSILDRNGRELAVSTMTKSLFVDPNHVEDPQKIAEDLSPLIDKPVEDILDDIDVGGGFVWVKRRMENSQYEAVRKLIREKGYHTCLGFRDEAKRFYPSDVLAANVIGFVGTDDIGLDGVEQTFDQYIKGEVTELSLVTDTHARPILDSIFLRRKYSGEYCKTIQLTIDAAAQFIVEQELDKAMASTDPKSITCIVMDPKTGEIIAMASRPSYNPNRFLDYDPEVWKNRSVSFIYEPGSTFKAVVAGAALQEGIVTPNQIFVDPGYVMVSGRRIQNWNGESFGTVTFIDVVKSSLNTCFAQVGLRLGSEKLMEYAKIFGFGEQTGIELPGEESGILFDPEEMRDSDIATTAIGQSIAVTPLQLVRAMAAIANDGILLKPHILKSIRNADGTIYLETHKEEIRRTIESATDKTLVSLLEQVVATGGGRKAAVKGYRIAGKTGTAQKISDTGVGYSEGSYIASFCGFAPVEDPRITVLVMIDEPAGNFYGGQIAAPVAGSIFSQLLRYMHVEPTNEEIANIEYEDEVEGEAAPQIRKPSDRKTIAEQEAENIDVPEGDVLVPNFIGKSIREVSALAQEKNLRLKTEGSGWADSQSIAPNTIVETNTQITVYFSP